MFLNQVDSQSNFRSGNYNWICTNVARSTDKSLCRQRAFSPITRATSGRAFAAFTTGDISISKSWQRPVSAARFFRSLS